MAYNIGLRVQDFVFILAQGNYHAYRRWLALKQDLNIFRGMEIIYTVNSQS